MARVAPLHSLSHKRPARSLRQIGIPDGRDVLTLYFWWVKQQHYRANAHRSPSISSSVRSVVGDLGREPALPVVRTTFESRRAALDLIGVGGQFD
ncbi:hypothetical protein BS50DRAFT_569002 [Corynespora cassiicola Philippines]|uniref:Uncharacterized protein n=1 Tax=Corynespora cassiicola Philippines TaxID=1448308 RepID=A0A2T2P705_CORCC|nr:hypothetical protein BS50DRAFT_569002 [Corynespora cassiicola Philippines]